MSIDQREEATEDNLLDYRKHKKQSCYSQLYKIVVLILLVSQVAVISYFVTVFWNNISPVIPPVQRIISETDSQISFEYVGSIINETVLSLPQIMQIINETYIHMPEIVSIIKQMNSSLPHIEAILEIVDNMHNIEQINNLISEIPEIINVINFVNASIPEIEYIMKIFNHKKNVTNDY